MVDVVFSIAGAAGRLAAQLIAPRLVNAVLGGPETRALKEAVQRALKAALTQQLKESGEGAAQEVMHLESVLGRYFAEPGVADPLIESALRLTDPPVEQLIDDLQSRGFDTETARTESGALLLSVGHALRQEIEIEASKPASPLFNMLMVSHITLRDSAAQAARVMGTAPPFPQVYVGREEDLRRLRERLKPESDGGSNSPRIVALRGWPGVGKTATAAAMAHDAALANVYQSGVLWARLGNEDRVKPELRAWSRSLGIYGSEELDVAALSARLAAVLRPLRMLLIIDDVWEPEHATPFMVGGADCGTVLTTRLKAVADTLTSSPTHVYRLDVLNEEAAVDLLIKLAPDVAAGHRDNLVELARALEFLPLALQMAGRLLSAEAGRGLPVVELLNEIRDGIRLFEEEVPAHLAGLVGESSVNLAAVMQRSVSDLSEEHQLRFAYLGAFASKPATFTTLQMEQVWSELDHPGAPSPVQTLRILVDRGLLEPIGTGVYQMHALLARFADSLLDQDD